MSITIFGIFWLFLILIAVFIKRKDMLFEIVLYSMVMQCAAVIELDSGQQVGPQIFSVSAYLAVYCLEFLTKAKVSPRKYKIKHITAAFLFLLLATILFSSTRAVYSHETYWQLYFIQLAIYVLLIVVLFEFKSITKESLYRMIRRLIIFVLVMGFIQLLTTTNILPRNIILETFVYTDTSESCAYNATYYARIFSTFMEPSYCSAFLVGAFFYIIAYEKKLKQNIFLSIAILVEIILTFSTTAYAATAVVGCIYLVVAKKKKALKYLIPLGILLVVFMAVTGELQTVLNKVLFEKYLTGSYVTRFNSDQRAIQAFLTSPIWGSGLQNIVGSRMYLSILGQLGLMGALLFAGAILSFCVYFYINREEDCCRATGLFLVSVVISVMISIPYIFFSIFWMILIICSVTVSICKNETESVKKEFEKYK